MAFKETYHQDIPFDQEFYLKRIQTLDVSLKQDLISCGRIYVFFNLLFLVLFIIESSGLVLYLLPEGISIKIAICIAVIFLTGFSYFIMRLYFQTKLPEKISFIKDNFIKQCENIIEYEKGLEIHERTLALAMNRLIKQLHGLEYTFYSHFSLGKPSINRIIEKFSWWWHWKEIHFFKELLMLYTIDKWICLIRKKPTHFQTHAILANTYVVLANHYNEALKILGIHKASQAIDSKFSRELYQRFEGSVNKAVEELKIMKIFSQDDPWIYLQLAHNYHELKMPEEEMEAYEKVVKLDVNDIDTLFSLGVLYFQQGMNVKGLEVYEKLNKANYYKSEELMQFYGVYQEYEEGFEFI